MQRICFTMSVASEHRDTYIRMHAEAWPELLRELDRSGWTNYSLFLHDDGLLVGYLETLDWQAAQEAMSMTDVSARWSAEMDKLVVPGSVMHYPQLVHALDGPSGRYRHCFVLNAPVDIADLRPRKAAIFESTDRHTIIYAESDHPNADLVRVGGQALREVFNLAELLRKPSR